MVKFAPGWHGNRRGIGKGSPWQLGHPNGHSAYEQNSKQANWPRFQVSSRMSSILRLSLGMRSPVYSRATWR